MPNDYTVTIYTKTYDLLAWLFPLTAKFPKEQRFVLAQRLIDAATELYELLITARRTKPAEARREILAQADVRLEQLRLYFRLSKDLKLISIPQYEQSAQRTDEIGRLLGDQIKRAQT